MNTEFNERDARLSPNGQWLAYSSNETKVNEVYVRTFAPTPAGSGGSGPAGGKWQISVGGGSRPVWSHDGKELFFRDSAGSISAVEVKSIMHNNAPVLQAGTPKRLFTPSTPNFEFDVSKDGRFLIPMRITEATVATMTVVYNWPSRLQK